MRKYLSLLPVFGLVALLLGALLVGQVQSEDVSNYAGIYTLDQGTTSVSLAGISSFTSTAIRVDGWGSVRVQVTQDYSGTGTVTYQPQIATDGTYYGSCSSVTSWADLTEQYVVECCGADAYKYITYTTVADYGTITSSLTGSTTGVITVPYPITTTYTYADVAAGSAGVTVVEQDRNFAVVNDATESRRFDVGGAYCFRLVGQSSVTATVTSTIYAAPVDVYGRDNN